MQSMVSVNELNRKLTRNRFRLLFTDFIIQVITQPSQAHWNDVDCFGCTCHANEAVQAYKLYRDWTAAQDKPPSPRAQNPPRPRGARARVRESPTFHQPHERFNQRNYSNEPHRLFHAISQACPQLLPNQSMCCCQWDIPQDPLPELQHNKNTSYQRNAAHATKDSFKIRQITKLHLYPAWTL